MCLTITQIERINPRQFKKLMGSSDFDKANMQAQHNLGLEWDIYVGTVDNLCGAFRERKQNLFPQGETLQEPL